MILSVEREVSQNGEGAGKEGLGSQTASWEQWVQRVRKKVGSKDELPQNPSWGWFHMECSQIFLLLHTHVPPFPEV